jgi:hypothetical protein
MIRLLRTMAGLPMLIISPIGFFRTMRNCGPAQGETYELTRPLAHGNQFSARACFHTNGVDHPNDRCLGSSRRHSCLPLSVSKAASHQIVGCSSETRKIRLP